MDLLLPKRLIQQPNRPEDTKFMGSKVVKENTETNKAKRKGPSHAVCTDYKRKEGQPHCKSISILSILHVI